MANKKKVAIVFWKILIGLIATATVFMLLFRVYEWWQERRAHFIRYEAFGIEIPTRYHIHGIDVSRYQETIDWQSVQGMNVEGVKLGFTFIKATEGIESEDRFFKRNWKKSREAGIVRGAYHFFIATKDGKLQAQNFIKNVNLDTGDLPPVLDVEQTYTANPDQLRKEIKTWLDVIENYYSVKPIIYTYLDFYDKNLKGYFDDYPLWVAHYLQPHQPRINRDWTFWQHSEQGHVNGIQSRVDFNVFNGDSLAFQALLVP